MLRTNQDIPNSVTPDERLLKYELTDINLLKPSDRNTRKHPDAQIAALTRSMETWGVVRFATAELVKAARNARFCHRLGGELQEAQCG